LPRAEKIFNKEDRKGKGKCEKKSEKGGYLLTLHLIEITPRQESLVLYWFSLTLTLGAYLEYISSGCHQGMLLSELHQQRQVPGCLELHVSA